VKQRSELKPGDFIYRCDFDGDESEPISFDEVPGTVEKMVVVHHADPDGKNNNLYAANVADNTAMCPSDFGVNRSYPVVRLWSLNDEEAETPLEAVKCEAAWRACYGQSHVRDAGILRSWIESQEATA
jgi:hypothetical protein